MDSIKNIQWANDKELFVLIKKYLYTPVLGDIMDSFKYFHQFLPQKIQAILPEMKLVGRAMPVLMMDVFGTQEKPFGKMMQALDDLKEDEIYIAGGACHRSANWGEIMTAAALARRASGAVIYGYHRDTPQVVEQNFPVFSCGSYAQDSSPRMKVAEYRIDIEIEGVKIDVGDLIFGDRDGVLVVPKKIEDKVIPLAFKKVMGEKKVRREIENGMSVEDAFNTYGIL